MRPRHGTARKCAETLFIVKAGVSPVLGDAGKLHNECHARWQFGMVKTCVGYMAKSPEYSGEVNVTGVATASRSPQLIA